jgi:hypothetical protein
MAHPDGVGQAVRLQLRRLRRADHRASAASPLSPSTRRPVIYSNEQRAKLVFMVEARPVPPTRRA